MLTNNDTTNSKSRHIANNTIVLFVRMIVLTAINLYAVRLVLRGLGDEDYGIFNTVIGVVTATNMFSGVLALAIQRFFSYALGQEDQKRLQDIFSVSIVIMGALSVGLFIFLETAGLWFVDTQLVIPLERMPAAHVAYQFSIITLLLSILQIPFMAAIFSHEDMGTYALISTAECLLKLGAAVSISILMADHLIVYSGGLALTSILVFFMYAIIARGYKECHFRKPQDRSLYRQLITFSGWTLFGSLASTAMIQGNTILLDIFFGPVIVAAFGIALQINNAFNALCNSLVLAFRPPMIKAFAEKSYNYLNQLFTVANKLMLYILIAIALPLIAEMDTILQIWLGNHSENTVLFARLIIVYMICLVLHNPITIIMQASGHVKEYHVPVEGFMLLCLPLTWLLFKLGMPAFSLLLTMIGITIVAHGIRLLCLRHFYQVFSIRNYFSTLIIPGTIILGIATLVTFLIRSHMDGSTLRLCLIFLIIPLVISMLVFLIGINKKERSLIVEMIFKPLLKKINL